MALGFPYFLLLSIHSFYIFLFSLSFFNLFNLPFLHLYLSFPSPLLLISIFLLLFPWLCIFLSIRCLPCSTSKQWVDRKRFWSHSVSSKSYPNPPLGGVRFYLLSAAHPASALFRRYPAYLDGLRAKFLFNAATRLSEERSQLKNRSPVQIEQCSHVIHTFGQDKRSYKTTQPHFSNRPSTQSASTHHPILHWEGKSDSEKQPRN